MTPPTKTLLLALLNWDRERIVPFRIARPNVGHEYVARQDAAAAALLGDVHPALWTQEVRDLFMVLIELGAGMIHGQRRVRTVAVGRAKLPPPPPGLTMLAVTAAAEEIGVRERLRHAGEPAHWR